ncbi:tRNA (adenosine(37)-N6)-threonylcarbamoyltransferase complex dimerization subunit type 1 TsaB [Singulisphaera sp. PoT]|uniref:tRNA (adenosine(37)-N6)-threonylcarbamoyltransferase complex dimerization subunit type 1 TsaB n=1 Tax=Singulisphaera sp. PoT TaxID=3411797 RepID=UPI003BF5D810
MYLLAIDTSTNSAAVAVAGPEGALLVAAPGSGQRHGRQLIPTIASLLSEAGLALADLDGFAVGLGPGSYTGLRIGLTAVKTLAYVTGKPVVGLNSLEVIAQNAPGEALSVSVVADAQRGDLYTLDLARSEPLGRLIASDSTRIEPRTAWESRLGKGTWVLGPGLDRLAGPLPDTLDVAPAAQNQPDARRLADLALRVWRSGLRHDAWSLEPLYLRRSAAEDQWERKAAPSA